MKTQVDWKEIDEDTVAIVTTVTYDKKELYDLLMMHLPPQRVVSQAEAKRIIKARETEAIEHED